MKVLLKVISTVLLIAMLGVLFVSCDEDESIGKPNVGAPTDFGKNETDYKDTLLESYLLKVPTEPISYEFESNGDGSCTLVGCSVNAESAAGGNIELPSVSPSGEKVTAIDLLEVTPNGNVPRVLTVETVDRLFETFEKNGATAFERLKFNSYYALIDLEQALELFEDDSLREKKKKSFLGKYPYAEVISLYVLSEDYGQMDLKDLSKIFGERGEYTQEDCINDYNNIIKTVIQSEKANDALIKSIPKPFVSKSGEIRSITVPEGVTSVENLGFETLESVNLPESLTSIGREAFRGSILESINIPEGVKTIGGEAFYTCENLKKVTIPAGVEVIEQRTFESCKNLSEAILPNGLTTIEAGAFQNCDALTSINIPKSVKVIQSNAFEECSSLRQINYSGTKAEWEALVSKNENINWDSGLSTSYDIICTDGVISHVNVSDG